MAVLRVLGIHLGLLLVAQVALGIHLDLHLVEVQRMRLEDVVEDGVWSVVVASMARGLLQGHSGVRG